MGFSDEYALWNARVAAFWLRKSDSSSLIYLAATPSSLAAAAHEYDGTRLTPEEAEKSIADAVGDMYRTRVAKDGLASLVGPLKQVPASSAFLAVSVLAAHRMQDDGNNTAGAYYVRLGELLRHPGVGHRFDTAGFERLWTSVSAWAKKTLGRALPQPPPTKNRYIAYPLAHAALRGADIVQLPRFFISAGYAPQQIVEPARLSNDFAKWRQHSTPRPLSAYRERACADERIGVVLQQVSDELRAWDGSTDAFVFDVPQRSSRPPIEVGERDEGASPIRTASVALTLDVRARRQRLAYLARRPDGFPATFSHGDHRFESVDVGWYDPLAVDHGDGESLRTGFQWLCSVGRRTFVLTRPPSAAIAFVNSEEYAGMTSRESLLLGVDCALLYHVTVRDRVHALIPQIAQECAPVENGGSTLPAGWLLIPRLRARAHAVALPPDLLALSVDTSVDILARGGLRIGRGADWLHGFAPTFQVSGDATEVRLDSRPLPSPSSGFVIDASRLSAGDHRIEAGRAVRNFRIVEPSLSASLAPLCAAAGVFAAPVPRGRWFIIGRSAAHVASVEVSGRTGWGLVTNLSFAPVWALSADDAGLALHVGVAGDDRPEADSDPTGEWSRALLRADDYAIATLIDGADASIVRSWSRYQRQARRFGKDTPAPQGAR